MLHCAHYPEFDEWLVRGAVTYLAKPFEGIDSRIDTAVSVRHRDTGLSLTGGVSRSELVGGDSSNGWIIKGGWITSLNSLGTTAFSLDYGTNADLRLPGDRAKSIGLFALQKWTELGLDLYAGYRLYDVDRPDVSLGRMDVYALGAIYNF